MIRIFLFLLLSTSVYSQTPGIYFVTVPTRNGFCEQKIGTYFGKGSYCISKKPIVGIEEIEYVTDILYDSQSKINYIDVGLSSASVSTLNKVYQSMPGSQLALVAEEKVLGRFTVDEKILARKMHIGKDLNLNQLKIIRDILKNQNLKKD